VLTTVSLMIKCAFFPLLILFSGSQISNGCAFQGKKHRELFLLGKFATLMKAQNADSRSSSAMIAQCTVSNGCAVYCGLLASSS